MFRQLTPPCHIQRVHPVGLRHFDLIVLSVECQSSTTLSYINVNTYTCMQHTILCGYGFILERMLCNNFKDDIH